MKTNRMQETKPKKQTILFIHGAWHGSWCWDKWQQYFSDRGYNAIAVDLRGHGSKTGSYKRARLANYISDVEMFLKQFDEPPILIGHSLGCKVIQHLLSKQDYPSAVMLAPIPEAKLFRRSFVRLITLYPWIFIQSVVTRNMKPWVSNKKSDKLFFSDELDKVTAQKYLNKMQGESFNIFLIDILFKATPKRYQTPMLLVAPEHDAFFLVKEQRKMAVLLTADFMIAYDSGHDVMLDVSEEVTVNSINSWITSVRKD